MKFHEKVYSLMPVHMKNWVQDTRRVVVPLYIQYRYKAKLVIYSLPLLVHWILPVTFEKDELSVKIAKRSMTLFFIFLTGTVGIYLSGIILLIILPSPYHFIISPYQFSAQTILTCYYTFLSLFYAYEISKDKNEIHPFYLKFTENMEKFLSQ